MKIRNEFHIIKWVLIPVLFLFNGLVNGQTCPKGFTEQYGYNTVGGGNTNDFKPSLIIRACVEDKSGAAGEQVFWNVKGLYHSYKTVRFTKHIKLTCGNVISKQVTLYDLKKDESIGGGSFSGDIDLSDNIFKEDCANAKRIASVWADNFSCELDDEDPLVVQEKNRQEQIREKSQASKSSSTTSTSGIQTPAPRAASNTSSSTSSGSGSGEKSSSGDGGRYAVAVTPTKTTQIYNELNRKMQNNRDTYQAVAGGLQELGAIWQASRERKQAEEDAAAERREQREAEEKERREENRRIEAERQAQLEEENAARAAAEKAEMNRQWGLDVEILGNYLVRKKTSEIPESLKTVYYIIYERNYKNNSVRLKTYSLKKYSDDTWMLQADLMKKLQFEQYFNKAGVGQFLGFYISKQQAQDAITKIRGGVATITVDDSFLELSGTAAGKADKDFWNN